MAAGSPPTSASMTGNATPSFMWDRLLSASVDDRHANPEPMPSHPGTAFHELQWHVPEGHHAGNAPAEIDARTHRCMHGARRHDGRNGRGGAERVAPLRRR